MADQERGGGRFWGSDTDSSSDSEDSLSSTTTDDEANNNNHQRVVQTTNRWAAEVEDSESSEDEGRVVKTMKVSKCFEKIPLDVGAFVMWTRMWKHGLSAVACRKHQSHFSFGVPMLRWLLLL